MDWLFIAKKKYSCLRTSRWKNIGFKIILLWLGIQLSPGHQVLNRIARWKSINQNSIENLCAQYCKNLLIFLQKACFLLKNSRNTAKKASTLEFSVGNVLLNKVYWNSANILNVVPLYRITHFQVKWTCGGG